jgi:hypothetical protein
MTIDTYARMRNSNRGKLSASERALKSFFTHVLLPGAYTLVQPVDVPRLPEPKIEVVTSTATPVVRESRLLSPPKINLVQARMHDIVEAIDAKESYFNLALEERIRLDAQAGFAYAYLAMQSGSGWNQL